MDLRKRHENQPFPSFAFAFASFISSICVRCQQSPIPCRLRVKDELPTQDFLHSLYALPARKLDLCVREKVGNLERQCGVLKVVHAHRSVTAVASETFQTPVCCFLTRVKIFAVSFSTGDGQLQFPSRSWRRVAKEASDIPGKLGLALGPSRRVFLVVLRCVRHRLRPK